MVMWDKKKVKLNNAGMTLVELLIAMAILAVSVTAILAAFVNSFRYSIMGRELQQTTVLANTIIENCKAYSYEDIYGQLLNADDAFLTGVKKANVELVGDTFYMQDVPLDNQLYDVALEMKARGINGSSTKAYNIMLSTSMNAYLDAVYLPQTAVWPVTNPGDPAPATTWTAAELDNKAYLDAIQKISDGIASATATKLGETNKVVLTHSYIEASFGDSSNPDYAANKNGLQLSRTTSIIINKDATNGEYVKVSIQYFFDLKSGIYKYKGVDALGGEFTYTYSTSGGIDLGTYDFIIYKNIGTNDAAHPTKIENVYFFYYPAYNYYTNTGGLTGSLYPFVSDTISISNYLTHTDGAGNEEPINVYIIKQKNPAYSDSKLTNFENTYETDVFYGTGAGPTNVYHNFKDNLGTEEIGGSFYYDASNTLKELDDGTAYGVVSGMEDPNNWIADEFTVKSNMITEDSKKLMYDIKVTIYDADAYDAATDTIDASKEVLSLEGTALDW